MSISNTTETAILKLVYQAITWTNYADSTTTGAQTQIAVALHTTGGGGPTDTDDASTAEISYTNYTRINVPRAAATPGWLEASGVITPTASIDFPAGGVGSSPTAASFSTSKSNATPPTGAQPILWSGTVSPNIICGNGVTPRLTTASTITLD